MDVGPKAPSEKTAGAETDRADIGSGCLVARGTERGECVGVSSGGQLRTADRHLVVAFQAFGGPPENDSHVAIDPAKGTTKSLGIYAGLDAGFDTKFTKAAVVHILTQDGRVPFTSTLSIQPLGKGRSTALWTFNSGIMTGQPEWNPPGRRSPSHSPSRTPTMTGPRLPTPSVRGCG